MQSAPQSLCIVHSSLTLKPHWLHSILPVELSNALTLWLKYAMCFDSGTSPLHPTVAPGICSDFSFKCKNGDCVNKVNAECDRVDDCSDNSDEASCSKKCFLSPLRCNIELFKFFKTAESGSNLFSVIQIDYRRAGWAARCCCLLEKRPRPWLLYLFHSSLKAALVISEVFVFFLHLSLRACLCIFFFSLFFLIS